jgi:hypothetical protein
MTRLLLVSSTIAQRENSLTGPTLACLNPNEGLSSAPCILRSVHRGGECGTTGVDLHRAG